MWVTPVEETRRAHLCPHNPTTESICHRTITRSFSCYVFRPAQAFWSGQSQLCKHGGTDLTKLERGLVSGDFVGWCHHIFITSSILQAGIHSVVPKCQLHTFLLSMARLGYFGPWVQVFFTVFSLAFSAKGHQSIPLCSVTGRVDRRVL